MARGRWHPGRSVLPWLTVLGGWMLVANSIRGPRMLLGLGFLACILLALAWASR